jgi:hypothetical protein
MKNYLTKNQEIHLKIEIIQFQMEDIVNPFSPQFCPSFAPVALYAWSGTSILARAHHSSLPLLTSFKPPFFHVWSSIFNTLGPRVIPPSPSSLTPLLHSITENANHGQSLALELERGGNFLLSPATTKLLKNNYFSYLPYSMSFSLSL